MLHSFVEKYQTAAFFVANVTLVMVFVRDASTWLAHNFNAKTKNKLFSTRGV